ncbi:MAG: tol-pal system protein YbgF [Candidatus Aquirickettsiella sp.]
MRLNLPSNRVFALAKRDFFIDQRINSRRVKLIKMGLCCMCLLLSSLTYALAPVVDAYDDDEDAPAAATSSVPSSSAGYAPNPTTPSSVPNAAPASVPALPSNSASFSLEQRVTILERQIANLNPLLVQIDDLQQQLQSLQGKLESQQHAVKMLEEQVRNQYLALDKRFAQRPNHNNSVYAEKSANVSKVGASDAMSPRPFVDLNSAKKGSLNDRKSMMPNAAPTAAAERAYQAAFQLLKTKQYNEAIVAFETFIKKFPNDLNVANADYFLGQLYLLQGQADPAINFFKRFITHYSQDARVPDAMLQCGLAYFAKGDKQSAMDMFEKIIQQYPDSKAAQAAQARLQQFKAMISAATIPSKNKA